jgi:[ribosomal protein S5]-alanine N-acetyltransferase
MKDKRFKPFPVLKTERLTLRQLVTGDANEIFALRSDSNVNKYLNRKPSRSIDDAKAFIQTIDENVQNGNSIYWAITLNGSDKLIGTVCLFDFSDDKSKAEIGYELLPGFQGKGIMQEAVSKVIEFGIQQLGLRSIEAYTHVENESSTRLLEQFPFKKNSAVQGDLIFFKLTSEEDS